MRILTTALLITAVILSAACSGSQQEVNVYSARHYDSDLTVYENFEAETGIKVNLIEGGSDELIERIKSEGENSPADVFIAVDAGRMWRAEQSDILTSLTTDTLENRIPSSLRHPDNLWISLTRRVRGIVYSTERVETDELSTYEDLADDRWEGRVCVRSSNNIYNQSLLASIIESAGEEAAEDWAEELVENFARDPQGGDTDQIRAVAAGECDVAIANHYYYMRLKASDSEEDQEVAAATAFFFPNQEGRGTHVNVSAAGLVANAPNRDNAVKLIEYMTSREAQEILVSSNKEYPANQFVPTPDALDELGNFKSDEVNVSAYGINNPAAVRIMDRVGWK